MRRLLLAVLLLSAARAGAAPFEDLGAGARAPGMGNAFTAIADDVYAVHYNPSGLATLDRPQLGLTYARFYLGLSDSSNLGQSNIAYAHPLRQGRWGTLGVSWQDFKLDSIYSERTIGLGYGRKVLQRAKLGTLFAGVTLKNLNRSFSPGDEAGNALDHGIATGQPDPLLSGAKSKSAMAADIGFLLRSPRRYALALAIANANQPDVSFGGSDKVPMKVKLAASYKSLWMNLAAEVQQQKAPTGKLDRDITLAGERTFPSLAYGEFGVRAALGVGSRDFRQVSLGLSYRINKIQTDYAFLMPLGGIKDTAGTHRMGLSFHFGALTAEEEFTNELVSQMQKLREKQTQGAGYEFGEVARPAELDRPALKSVREKVEAGEFLHAHQALKRLINELPPDSSLIHLAKRLDIVSSFFPDLVAPKEKWEVAAANASRAFLYGKDSTSMLLAAYSASLAPKQLKLDKFVARLEAATQLEAEKPVAGKDLLETKHLQAQSAFGARDYQTALNEARDALELEPSDLRALKRVGSSLFMLGYYPESISVWENALNLETNVNERVALEHYIAKAREGIAAGQKPTQQLEPRKAKRIAVAAPSAAATEPADPRAIERLYQRGMEHYARGEMLLAAAAFQRIVVLDPDNALARKALERIRRSER